MNINKEILSTAAVILLIVARFAFKFLRSIHRLPKQRRVPLPRTAPTDFTRNS